jgi:hypothetical protein
MRPRAAGTQGIILPPSPDGAAIDADEDDEVAEDLWPLD